MLILKSLELVNGFHSMNAPLDTNICVVIFVVGLILRLPYPNCCSTGLSIKISNVLWSNLPEIF